MRKSRIYILDARLLTLALGLVCVGLIVAGVVVAIVLFVVRKNQGPGGSGTMPDTLMDAWERASPEERQALLDRLGQDPRENAAPRLHPLVRPSAQTVTTVCGLFLVQHSFPRTCVDPNIKGNESSPIRQCEKHE